MGEVQRHLPELIAPMGWDILDEPVVQPHDKDAAVGVGHGHQRNGHVPQRRPG